MNLNFLLYYLYPLKSKRVCSIDFDVCFVCCVFLWQGFGDSKDINSVQKIILEMKTYIGLFIDRTAYTAAADALLNCGSIKGMLCMKNSLQYKEFQSSKIVDSHIYAFS